MAAPAVQVMLVDYRPGTAWLLDRVAVLRGSWGGRFYSLPDLLDEGVATVVAAGDRAAAASGVDDAITNRRLRHGNQPALTVAVAAARWRDRGEGRVLDRRGETDISPLVAVVLAWHGLTNVPTADAYVM
jgi:hypothetical protein